MNNDLGHKAEMHNNDEEMLPEYDFSGKIGVRGKYYRTMRQGYTTKVTQEDGTTVIHQITRPERTVTLDPDVQVYFPDAESVNTALRSLIRLIPTKPVRRGRPYPRTKRRT